MGKAKNHKKRIIRSSFLTIAALVLLCCAVYAANLGNLRVNVHYILDGVDISLAFEKDGISSSSLKLSNLAPASGPESPSAVSCYAVVKNIADQDVYYRLYLQAPEGAAVDLKDSLMLELSHDGTVFYQGSAQALSEGLLGVPASAPQRFLKAGEEERVLVRAWLKAEAGNSYQAQQSSYELVCQAVQAKNQEDGNVQFT